MRKQGFAKKILRFAPLLLCLLFLGLYLIYGRNMKAESLAAFAPNSPFGAAIFMLLLYAIKSLTVFFPILVLNILGGFLFDPPMAVLVNCIGVLLELSIPYWVARITNTNIIEKFEQKHPVIARAFGTHSKNLFFLSFFLRSLFCLPGDAISLYFGAIKMPFKQYIIGSFLGMLSGTVSATLLGQNITDPTSPAFLISLSITVLVSLTSLVIYCIYKRKRIDLHESNDDFI